MTSATPNATTPDSSGTVRGQIEFSLNLLRIASPRKLASERPGDVSSASADIAALQELLHRVDSI
jgi:hypothetical protein